MQTVKGPRFGLFDSLENWVEKGSPDENIVATKYGRSTNAGMTAVFTRPLCAYPRVAQYKGNGDTNDAANYACVTP
jgi:feruloyl esterase